MRTDFRPTDPRDEHGPYADEPDAVDAHDTVTHPRRTRAEAHRALLEFDDPHAAYLTADGRCRTCGSHYRHLSACPHVPGNLPTPALHSTVGKRDGGSVDIGLVVGAALVLPGGVHEVAVEWDDHISSEPVADLLTDIGACSHGRGAGRCGEPTAPGFERCEQHGGADPLPVPR